MGLFDWNKKKIPEPEKQNAKSGKGYDETISELFMMGGGTVYSPRNPIIRRRFDGEKNTGQLGVVIDNIIDYKSLAYRALNGYLTQDTIKILVNRKLQWIIGEGLKLEVMPNKKILELSGITISESFYSTVEGYWGIYCDSLYFDHSRKRNFHQIAWDAKKAIINSGDVLVICRVEEEGPTVQLISGEFVETPPDTSDIKALKGKDNYIDNGIEINEKGEHVAYYVRKRDKKNGILGVYEYERVLAVGEKTKKRLAWMVYAEKVSHDHERAVPDATPVIEKAEKMDRYSEAAVTKAEHSANIVYTIKHDNNSTGENPLKDLVKRKMAGVEGVEQDPDLAKHPYVLGNALAQQIAQQTEGTVVNLPIGSEFDAFSSDIESQYGPFDEANFKKISAAMDMPAEVALHSYNSNYSASRAAINGAGHMFQIDAKKFSDQFYTPLYKIWLEVMVLKNMIEAPGYIKALNESNIFVIEAYSKARFVGKRMPHIDPLKEANAIRKLLGDRSKGELPLISNEQATEMANAGDWRENIEEYLEEIKLNAVKQINDASTNSTKESGNPME